MSVRPLHLALLVGLAFPVAGCISFGPKPPPSLLTLSSASEIPAGTARTVNDGQAVLIAAPSVPQSLAALRVPVQTTPTEIAYIKDAQWADTPARLFRNLLADTVAARTGRVVIEPRGAAVSPGMRLSGRLQNFGLDAASRSAVVTYDAALSRGTNPAVSTRRFEARVPVTVEDGPNVAAALSQGANQVAAQVADWVGR